MALLQISAAEVRSRPGRTILTLLSIVIGVAAVVAVSFAMTTTRTAYQTMYHAVSGRAALEVTAAGGGGFDKQVLETVRQVPGVKVAVPVIERQMKLIVKGQYVRTLGLGIDPKLDSEVRDYKLVKGKFFDDGQGVLLDVGFAKSLDAEVGTPVQILARRGRTKTFVAGLLKPTGVSTTVQGPVVMMPLDTAEYRFVTRDKIDSVQIVLDAGANEDQVSRQIAAKLPPGLEIHPPALRSRMAEETMNAIEHGLQMSREFALLAAVFIIMNTFLMSLSQRRRHLAIMRAIGATRRQIARVLYREAICLGLVGTVLGSLLGWWAAQFLNRGMGQLFQATMPPLAFQWPPLVWGAVCGMGISLVGVYVPARSARRLTPLEGMRPMIQQTTESSHRWTELAGLALIAVSAGLLLACRFGRLPVTFSVPAALVGLIGLVMVGPLFVPACTAVGAAVLRPLLRVESNLARLQLLRHRGRTTLTIGVLFIAFSTGVGLACTIMDNVDDVRLWYRRAIVGDFFVRSTMPDMALGTAAEMPSRIDAELRDSGHTVD